MMEHAQVSKICCSLPLSNHNWFDIFLILGIATTDTTTETTRSLPESPTRGTLLLIKCCALDLLL